MKEVYGNLWEYPAKVRVITTNGFVRKDGRAVMGRGCAREAAQRYPELPLKLGYRIQHYGNRPFFFSKFDLATLPVKHNWWEEADMKLIESSLKQLVHLLETITDTGPYVLPRPGCGNGKLQWDEVKELMTGLSNDYHVITRQNSRRKM